MFELRDYQKTGVMAVRQAIIDGNTRPLIVLPTGGGKSVILGDIIRRAVDKGHTVLWMVHRRNLVFQMKETLEKFGVKTGVIMSGHKPDDAAPAQVGTIQTYSKRISKKKDFNPHFFSADILMIDEAHRSVSPTYQAVIKQYPNAVLIGCTATPLRGDGRGLGAVYNDLIEISDVRELTNQGYLAPARYFAPTTIDTRGIRSSGGDFILRELGDRVNNTSITGDVVTNWLKIAENRKTLVFAVDVKHSIAIRDEFRRKSVACEHLDAHSSDDTRDGVFRAMERDEIRVVTNVAVYQEGLDVPDISCIVMARPTKSLGLWKQCPGRGLRPADGKADCLILDHGGNIDRLGFLDETVFWSLDEAESGWVKPKPKEKDPKKMTCKECGEIFSGGSSCPTCGSPIKSYGRHVQTYEAELMELEAKKRKKTNRDMSWPEKIEIFAGLKWWELKKDWNPGRKAHLYRLLTTVWPNDPRLKDALPKKPSGHAANMIKYLFIKSAKSRKGG